MRPIIAALVAAFFVLTSPVKADEKLIDVFERTSGSVGALYKAEDGGNMSFLCSVTVVGEHEGQAVLLTAFHCVTRGVSYRVTLDGKRFHEARVWKIPHYEVDAKEYPRTFHEPRTDMALYLSDVDAPAIEMADVADQRPGAGVVMVGFPLGLAKVSYEGIVSGYFHRPGADDHGYQLLQIFGAPGSSGSAVIDVETGKIISVLVAGKQSRSGLPVIFATPVEYQSYLMEVPTDSARDADPE